MVWGTTFVSTKFLLNDFLPVEILLFRFILGFLALCAACPHNVKFGSWRQEAVLAGAGLSGITLYYLMENLALSYSAASNVSVICSSAPLFTALLGRLFLREEGRLRPGFFVGFALAMAGVGLIAFNGAQLKLNPMGDVLALLAAVLWGVYSVLSRKMAAFGLTTLEATKRTFAYGILFMLPISALFPIHVGIERFLKPLNLANLLFLSLCASALCFVTWNFAVKRLGAVKTSVYIYGIPVVTVIFSTAVLGEKLTPALLAGTALTLAGLILSEYRRGEKAAPAAHSEGE